MCGATVSFSTADVRHMADAYDPNIRPAPLCPGHPDNDQPVMGQVEGLFADSSGTRLFAQAVVSPALVESVRDGLMTSVSAAFIRPDQPTNPKPWAYYLRHVGFLWNNIQPAVKGMQPLAFSSLGSVLAYSAASALAEKTPVVAFSAPPGCSVNAERLHLHQVALEHIAADPGLPYVMAVARAEKFIG